MYAERIGRGLPHLPAAPGPPRLRRGAAHGLGRRPRASPRLLVVLLAAVAACACVAQGHGWLYEHVERPVARALCGTAGGGCVLDAGAEPGNVLLLVVLLVVASAWFGLALRGAGRTDTPRRRAVLHATGTGAAVGAITVVTLLGLRVGGLPLDGPQASGVCLPYPGRSPAPGPLFPAGALGGERCAPSRPPDGQAWIWLLVGVRLWLVAVGTASIRTSPVARVRRLLRGRRARRIDAG